MKINLLHKYTEKGGFLYKYSFLVDKQVDGKAP